MERLTERDQYGNSDIIGVDSGDLQLSLEFDEFNRVTDALNKLAAYEDTNLTPAEIAAVQTELAQLREAHTCEWTEIDADAGHWQCSECGVEWYMSDGDMLDNDMHYCPRCGKEIVAENRDVWSEEEGKHYERILLTTPPANGGGKE